jgi:exonuclease SbcC
LKPLKLSIAGLQSFTERQEIDFEELCETGLFGIFGPTGSGKSTILDAITLALYGNVERAARGTTGILNSQKDLLEVSFTFTIGTDSNRKIYRAERGFKRNKTERDSIRAGICRLVHVGGDFEKVVAEGAEEVNRKVTEIVGLTMGDFTRSVVLPQGEFAKFLNMGDAERVRMLERIFALSEFGMKLTEKVKHERAKLEQELGLLERAIQEQGEISPETITGLRNELDRLEQERREALAESQEIEALYEQTKTVWELQAELAQVQAEESKLTAGGEHIATLKTALVAAENAEVTRPYLDSFHKAEQNLLQAQQAVVNTINAYEEIEKNHRGLKEQLQQAEQKYREEQPQLIAQKTKLQGLADIEQDLAQKERLLEELRSTYKEAYDALNILEEDINNGLAQRAKTEADLSELQGRISGFSVSSDYKEKVLKGAVLERDYQNTQEAFDKLAQQLEAENWEKADQEQTLAELEDKRSKLDEELGRFNQELEELIRSKPGDINFYQNKNDELSELEKHIQSISLLENETEKDTAELNLYQSDLQSAQSKFTNYETQAIELKNTGLSLEENRHQLQSDIEELNERASAFRLANFLINGKPCPVCGSTDHPEPADTLNTGEMDAKKAAMAELETVISQHKSQYETLQHELSKSQTIIEQKQDQLSKLQARLREKQTQSNELRNLLPASIQGYHPADLIRFAAEEKQKVTDLKLAMNDWEARNTDLQSQIEALKSEKAGLEAIINEKSGRLSAIHNNTLKLQDSLAAMTLILGEKQAQYLAIKNEMNITDFQAESSRVLASDRQSEELRRKLDELTNERQLTTNMIEEWKIKKESAQLKLREVEFTGKSLRDETAAMKAKLQEAVGDQKPGEIIADIEKQLQDLAAAGEMAAKQLEASREALQSAMAAKSENLKAVTLYQEGKDLAWANLERKLADRGFPDVTAVENALRNETERESIRKEINEYDELRKRYKQEQESLQKRLAGRTVTPVEWDRIQNLKIEISQRKDLLVEQVAKISHNLEDFETRYQKIKEYQKQQTTMAARKSVADELLKLLQGDALVAYIAEEHMHYILKDASVRLAMLTNKRYALLMDQSPGAGKDFIIQDNTNGGISRPVSTLSGGETFLVSLSLALALSSQIQLKGINPLEFFFLDEGFGTLDPQLLEVVMDSLEKLRHENLTVGIISHVPELRNRISRRLIVTPATVSGSGSRVRIEKA